MTTHVIHNFHIWRQMLAKLSVLSLVMFVLLGCGRRRSGNIVERPDPREEISEFVVRAPLPLRHLGHTKQLFRKVPTAESRIDLVHKFPVDAPTSLLSDQYSGSGVCIGDADGDGLPDIYITNYDQGNRLYRNLGGFRFEDVTKSAGVSGEGRWCAGASFVDIDNDSDLDLCVCVFNAPNLLYMNKGNGVFEDQAQQRGVDSSGASVMMTFADYDLDGDLDGYLVTHRMNIGADFKLPKSSKEAKDRGIVELASAKSKLPGDIVSCLN